MNDKMVTLEAKEKEIEAKEMAIKTAIQEAETMKADYKQKLIDAMNKIISEITII